MTNYKVLFVQRNLFHRVVATVTQFALWIAALFINHYYLGGSGWVNFTICTVFIFLAATNNGIKKMSAEEAMEFFSAMKEEQKDD